MLIASNVLVGILAFLHVWFMILEMFFWTKPLGLRTFGRTQQQADDSASLAANQGLYNGFLAAGCIWGLVATDPIAFQVKLFFCACVLVAGIYGGFTAKRTILFVQALPGLIALITVWLSHA